MSDDHSFEVGNYYLTPSLKGVIQQVTHLAFFGDGMSVVQGEEGSGKTSLAMELPSYLSQAHDVVLVTLHSPTELGDCIELVSRELGLSKDQSLTIGEMLSELRHYEQSLINDNKLVALIIDDAHHMDDQAIGALLSLLQGKGKTNVGLHFILLSQPGLEKRVDALQIIDVAVYDFSMPEFSPSEMAAFLDRDPKLRDALNSAIVQKIWSSSRGNPGIALRLVHKDNAPAANESARAWSAMGIPYGHLAAIAVLALVLGWSILMRDSGQEDNSGASYPSEESLSPVAVLQSPSPAFKGASQNQAATQPTAVEQEPNAPAFSPKMFVVTGERSVAQVSEAPEQDATSSIGDLDDPITQAETLDEKLQDSDDPELRLDREKELPRDSLINTTEAQVPKQTARVEAESTLDEKVDGAITQGYTPQERFLLDQDPETYTLQVVAASKIESLQAYIERQSNRDALHLYRGVREGKRWFVVVQGVYRTRELALVARQNLPEEQSKAGPWPRKLSSIQEEIQQHNRLDISGDRF